MSAKLIIRLHRGFILLVLAVALTATGFAHRMPTAQDGALAFALVNGADAADFCGTLPGKDRATGMSCPACQITACADLPPLDSALIDIDHAFHTAVIAPREALALHRVLDPAHTPQGPPVA
jgi:hypothetical protein